MLIIKKVTIDGTDYEITLSENSEALHAAYAAGGAIIGIWDEKTGGEDFSSCLYMVTDPEDADERLLERAARRRHGIPWIIVETERLLIREFDKKDPLEAAGDQGIFTSREKRNAYIDGQYRFYECGLWAMIEKSTGKLIGRAGLTDGELGYLLYPPYRRKGYAFEACKAILDYGRTELFLSEVFLKAARENKASLALAARLGFWFVKEDNGLLLYRKQL